MGGIQEERLPEAGECLVKEAVPVDLTSPTAWRKPV